MRIAVAMMDPSPSPPGVDVIIVNWNGGSELVESVRSAARAGGSPILVDNASTGGSLAEAATVPGVRLVRSPRNLGFAAGCHAGVAAGSGSVLLFLNPDAAIVEGSVTDLAAVLAAPGPCVVGMRLEDGAGRPIPSTRRLPSGRDLVGDLLRLRVLSRASGGRTGPAVEPAGTGPSYVVGSAFAMRRSDWDALGGLDPGFFLWYEEVDLCHRLLDAGGSVRSAPAIRVRHLGARSWDRLPRRRRQWLKARSTFRYARRHHDRSTQVAVLLAAPAGIAGGVIQDVVLRAIALRRSRSGRRERRDAGRG